MRGTMTERSDGVWRLRVVTGYKTDGQPIQMSKTVHGTKKRAQDVLNKLLTEVTERNTPLSGTMTYENFLTNHYLPHVKARLSPETYRCYLGKLNKRIIPTLGKVRLDKLSGAHIDRAYAEWMPQMMVSSLLAHHALIKSSLNQAIKWGLIVRSPVLQTSPPSGTPRKYTIPTIEQIQQLVEACVKDDPTLSVAIMLAALTGARRGELCGLRWSDVDRVQMTLTIERGVKRGEDGRRLVGPTKTHTARNLSIDEITLAVLDAHRKQCEEWAAAGNIDLKDGYILGWDDPSFHRPARPNMVTAKFARLSAQVGVKVRFHDLRHAVATTLLANGTDLAVVAGRLGHSSPLITMRVYAHVLENKDRQAAGVMGALLTSTK